MAAAVAAVSRHLGGDVGLCVNGQAVTPALELPECFADYPATPNLPGHVLEHVTTADARRARGVHFTPPSVARRLVDFCLDLAPAPRSVLDPACGGGVFLLAAADALEDATGAARAKIVETLHGRDVDPLAVAVTRAVLELWAQQPSPRGNVCVADAVFDPLPASDLIIGNPPFLGQLRSGTARSSEQRAKIRDRWPDVGGYVDTSALFFLAALDASPEACVALIQPISILTVRDAASVRRQLTERGALAGLWIDAERVFDAGVDTCAPVILGGAAPTAVRRATGTSPTSAAMASDAAPPRAENWGAIVADLFGVPMIDRPDGALLGSVARCTAGFRDQYYGLRGAVDDGGEGAPLITSGLIDPFRCHWGERDCRFDGTRWQRPTVRVDQVDAGIRGWVAERLTPKLVVASQTRVVEVAVDERGEWVPCTPVIVVEPHDHAPSLWHLAAAIGSPPAAAWLAADATGSALSAGALRVSARGLAGLPLPEEGPAWDAAAEAARTVAAGELTTGSLRASADAGCTAYGVAHPELVEWWMARIPSARQARSATEST